MSIFRQRLSKLVTEAGGIIKDEIFVVKPGVQILETSQPTAQATNLYKQMNLNLDPYLQAAEFKGRITYLSFKKDSSDAQSKQFHELMIKKLKHLSVYAGTDVTFLIAGCSVETSLELIAHHEARVARLTSSKTNAMTDTLYRIQQVAEVDTEKQMACVKEFLQLRNKWKQLNMSTEMYNMFKYV